MMTNFSLIETMLWEHENGIFLLPYHLQRLERSARFFGFSCDMGAVEQMLLAEVKRLRGGMPSVFICEHERSIVEGECRHKIRLLLHKNSTITIQSTPLAPLNMQTVGFATHPVQSSNIYLQHKTTHRPMYAQAKASRPDTDDVILWNEKGGITETSISNIVVEMDGQKWTPPVASGLLAGTFRAHLLDQCIIQERPITKTELANCEKIYLINSVRRWQQVRLVDVLVLG